MKKLMLPILLLMSKVNAQEVLYENNQEIDKVLSNNTYEPNYFSMLLGLFLVIGLVYLTSYLYQKLTKIKLNNQEDENNKIEIKSVVNLGQNKSLYVVKINEEYSLIGATQNSINYLKDIKQDF